VKNIGGSRAAKRVANSDALTSILETIFTGRTLEEWKKILVSARGAWSWVQTPEEVYEDPQTIANGFLRYVRLPRRRPETTGPTDSV
jgi:crotonobetainyl-CoA:carnitine CoA-transferase CaiB-like acyl-CoA transferase